MRKVEGIEPVSRMATSAVIADRIREAIIAGSFHPGEQLGEAHLAEALGVSRGPVREALQRLIQEGVLHSEPNRGVFVMRLDADDIADIYFARTLVERAALIRLLERRDQTALDSMRHAVDQMRRAARKRDAAGMVRWDLEFHSVLTQAAASKRLARMSQTLMTETRMILTAGGHGRQLDSHVIDEHADILDALEAGDRRRALSLVDEHMASGVARRLREERAASSSGR